MKWSSAQAKPSDNNVSLRLLSHGKNYPRPSSFSADGAFHTKTSGQASQSGERHGEKGAMNFFFPEGRNFSTHDSRTLTSNSATSASHPSSSCAAPTFPRGSSTHALVGTLARSLPPVNRVLVLAARRQKALRGSE